MIRRIQNNDIDKILNLSDNHLGRNYINKLIIDEYLKTETNNCFSYLINGQLVAFALNFINFRSNLNHIIDTRTTDNEKVGVIKTIVVDDKFQHKGIASALVTKSVQLLSKSCKEIICIVWDHPNNSMDFILQKHNFKRYKHISEFWKQESTARNFECKICGKPPCICSAEIWTLKYDV